MAAKLILISAVSGTTPTYSLTVDSTSGVVVNDHVSDNGGDIYRVSVIVDATHLTVVDDVAPDALEGTPIVGIGSVYTPTINMKLSQPPFNTPGWGEMLRRDMRRIDQLAVSFVHKVTVTYSNLTSAALIHDIVILSLPAKSKIMRIIADVTIPFTGGLISSGTLQVGKTTGGNEYLLSASDFTIGTFGDILAEEGASLSAGVGDIPNWASATDISSRFTAVGGNVNTYTAGSVTFYIEVVAYT